MGRRLSQFRHQRHFDDLENLGSTTLTIRLELVDAPTFSDSILSTTGFTLAPGSGWEKVIFPIGDLSDWNGNVDASFGVPASDVAFDLSHSTVLRIINASTDTSDFDPIASKLGLTTSQPSPSRRRRHCWVG